MNHEVQNWLRDFLPDIHLQSNGSTGGWTAKCYLLCGKSSYTYITLEFRDFPTMEDIFIAAQKMILSKEPQ